MIFGDNIFYGNGLGKILRKVVFDNKNNKVIVFVYYVNDLERFGVVEFDENNNVIFVEEKLLNLKLNYVIIGLYIYDNRVVDFVKKVKLSFCGELEIIDLNKIYFEKGDLRVELLGRGFVWLDIGIIESLYEVVFFVKIVEER